MHCDLRSRVRKKAPLFISAAVSFPPPWCRSRNFGRRGLLCLVVSSQTTCAYKYSRRQRRGDKEEGMEEKGGLAFLFR